MHVASVLQRLLTLLLPLTHAAVDMQVCKVYVGSFNTAPIRSDINPYGPELFNKEQEDLLTDLYEIPQRSCDRKVQPRCVCVCRGACADADVLTRITQINEFVKRVRAFRIHMLIISHLRKQMPVMMGKKSTQVCCPRLWEWRSCALGIPTGQAVRQPGQRVSSSAARTPPATRCVHWTTRINHVHAFHTVVTGCPAQVTFPTSTATGRS